MPRQPARDVEVLPLEPSEYMDVLEDAGLTSRFEIFWNIISEHSTGKRLVLLQCDHGIAVVFISVTSLAGRHPIFFINIETQMNARRFEGMQKGLRRMQLRPVQQRRNNHTFKRHFWATEKGSVKRFPTLKFLSKAISYEKWSPVGLMKIGQYYNISELMLGWKLGCKEKRY